MEEQVLFGAEEIARTINRLAHEVLEKGAGTKDLVLLGIQTRGAYLVRRIAARIEALSGTDPTVRIIDVSPYRDDRDSDAEAIESAEREIPISVDDTTVIIVDDVIYTGRTIRAALELINRLGNPKKILVASFVDRGERELPIKADIVGKNVQVSESQRVNVRFVESDGIDQVTVTSNTRGAVSGRGHF